MKKHWRELIIFALALLLTAVSCGPGATPTPLPPPTDVPEVLATKNEDIAGVWLQVFPPSGELGPGEAHSEFRTDGSGVGTVLSGKFTGTKATSKFWFEGSLVKMQQDGDTRIGTYQVYVSKRGGKPLQLRFVAVDDPYAGRKDRLTYKPLTRVEP